MEKTKRDELYEGIVKNYNWFVIKSFTKGDSEFFICDKGTFTLLNEYDQGLNFLLEEKMCEPDIERGVPVIKTSDEEAYKNARVSIFYANQIVDCDWRNTLERALMSKKETEKSNSFRVVSKCIDIREAGTHMDMIQENSERQKQRSF